MTEISILDLQTFVILSADIPLPTVKMTDYASKSRDPEIKKLFQEAADSAMKNKQELMKIPVIFHNFHETNNQNHYRTR